VVRLPRLSIGRVGLSVSCPHTFHWLRSYTINVINEHRTVCLNVCKVPRTDRCVATTRPFSNVNDIVSAVCVQLLYCESNSWSAMLRSITCFQLLRSRLEQNMYVSVIVSVYWSWWYDDNIKQYGELFLYSNKKLWYMCNVQQKLGTEFWKFYHKGLCEMPTIQYSARSARLPVHKLFTSSIRRGHVSCDSVVDGDWLPATEWCQRFLPCS